MRALSCVFGFLLPMRFLRDLMASLGATVLDLMTSEISRLSAMSSLRHGWSVHVPRLERPWLFSYKLLPVALSICSSKAVLADDDHQPIMVGVGGGRRCADEQLSWRVEGWMTLSCETDDADEEC